MRLLQLIILSQRNGKRLARPSLPPNSGFTATASRSRNTDFTTFYRPHRLTLFTAMSGVTSGKRRTPIFTAKSVEPYNGWSSLLVLSPPPPRSLEDLDGRREVVVTELFRALD